MPRRPLPLPRRKNKPCAPCALGWNAESPALVPLEPRGASFFARGFGGKPFGLSGFVVPWRRYASVRVGARRPGRAGQAGQGDRVSGARWLAVSRHRASCNAHHAFLHISVAGWRPSALRPSAQGAPGPRGQKRKLAPAVNTYLAKLTFAGITSGWPCWSSR